MAQFQAAYARSEVGCEGKACSKLLSITYNDQNEPVEKVVETWNLDTDAQGQARQQIKAAVKAAIPSVVHADRRQRPCDRRGLRVRRARRQFRRPRVSVQRHLNWSRDSSREYAPGDKVRLMINTNRAGGAVVLFLRPTNGIYLAPKVIRLDGKSTVEEVAVVQKDMPNFFIEAFTIAGGKLHSELREVVVPPSKNGSSMWPYCHRKKKALQARLAEAKVKLQAHRYRSGSRLSAQPSYRFMTRAWNISLAAATSRRFVGVFLEMASERSTRAPNRHWDRFFHNLPKNGELGMSKPWNFW